MKAALKRGSKNSNGGLFPTSGTLHRLFPGKIFAIILHGGIDPGQTMIFLNSKVLISSMRTGNLSNYLLCSLSA